MKKVLWIALALSLMACGCGSSRGKMVKANTTPAQETVTPPSTGSPRSAGHSFAYEVSLEGGVLKRLLKDIPREQYVREVELRHAADKNSRYQEKIIKPAGTSLMQLAAGAGSLALMPGTGAPATTGNIAKSVGSLALATNVGASSRMLSDWEKHMLLAWVMPWMPVSEAKTAEEAQAKMRQVLEQATRGTDMGDSALVNLPLPVLVNPPGVVAEALKYTGQVWSWSRGPGLYYTASKMDPRQYKVYAAHDDVANWTRISGRLPRWCFVYLYGGLASNGNHFIGYPQVLWQGKSYYFGE